MVEARFGENENLAMNSSVTCDESVTVPATVLAVAGARTNSKIGAAAFIPTAIREKTTQQ